jgi:hypothetical protein
MRRRNTKIIKEIKLYKQELFEKWQNGGNVKTKPRDIVISEITIHFGFIDRLRILLRGKARVRVETATENIVGRAMTVSDAWCPPLFHRGGHMMEKTD